MKSPCWLLGTTGEEPADISENSNEWMTRRLQYRSLPGVILITTQVKKGTTANRLGDASLGDFGLGGFERYRLFPTIEDLIFELLVIGHNRQI